MMKEKSFGPHQRPKPIWTNLAVKKRGKSAQFHALKCIGAIGKCKEEFKNLYSEGKGNSASTDKQNQLTQFHMSKEARLLKKVILAKRSWYRRN